MKLTLGTIILLILIGMLITPYDFDISKKLYDPHAAWAVWIEKYGEIPGFLVILLALGIFTASLTRPLPLSSRVVRIMVCIFRVILYLLSVGIGVLLFQYVIYRSVGSYLGYKATGELVALNEQHGTLFFIISLGLVLGISSVCIGFAKFFSERHYLFMKLVILQAIISQAFIQTLKVCWGRVRFRDLAYQNAQFCPWYIPQQLGGESFPSGHTGLGWMLLAVFLLVSQKRPYLQRLVFTLTVVWGIIVALSRVVVGAHHSTDVWFASIVTVIPFLVLWQVWQKDTKKSQELIAGETEKKN